MQIIFKIVGAALAVSFLLFFTASADETCEADIQACMNRALDGYADCTDACNIYEGTRWNTCTDRCETKTRRSERACEADYSCAPKSIDNGQVNGSSAPPRPEKAEGQGCYLGECPDDLDVKPVVESKPTHTPQPYQSPMPQQIQYSWLCQTPQHWCMMNQSPQALPVGSPCYCMNPIFGYANGMVIPQQ